MGSIGQRVMVKVVNKLGGVRRAALELGISESILTRFIEGAMKVPDSVLLRAVDYVLEDVPVRKPFGAVVAEKPLLASETVPVVVPKKPTT